MKLISQEAPMGCAIACAASLTGLSYKEMRKWFKNARREYASGFYNRDIVEALNKVNTLAKAYSVKRFGKRKIKVGSVVFIGKSKLYPRGHYLLKTKKGWMNPWINFPDFPVEAGYQKRIPGKIRWLIVVQS